MFSHQRGSRQAARLLNPSFTRLIWPPHIHIRVHGRANSSQGLGDDLRLSWWQLVTLFKLTQIDPLRHVCVGGWVVGVGLSDRWQSTISNKHQVTPDRDWWYEHVNWRGAWRYHRNRECGCIWNQERSACTHKNLHLSYPAHGCHPTHHVWKDRQLRDRSRRCLQMTFTEACSHTRTHARDDNINKPMVPGGSPSSIWSLMSSGLFL